MRNREPRVYYPIHPFTVFAGLFEASLSLNYQCDQRTHDTDVTLVLRLFLGLVVNTLRDQ